MTMLTRKTRIELLIVHLIAVACAGRTTFDGRYNHYFANGFVVDSSSRKVKTKRLMTKNKQLTDSDDSNNYNAISAVGGSSSSNNDNEKSVVKNKQEPDLFEFFDPLLSPHAYPEGVSPETKPIIGRVEQQKRLEQDQRLPQKLGFKLTSNPDVTGESTTNDKETKDDEKKEDIFDYFDPLLSPHAYPDGIKPSANANDNDNDKEVTPDCENNSGKKIGVLLMDHGSRKEASNARLQAMAKLYQMTVSADEDISTSASPTIIVRAAHMEIASPSIPDGLKTLKDEGVDEIICHPFFLSADGRHVKEDIPQIIDDAIDKLWGGDKELTKIPIVTTAPVGSNTQLMLGAIHSLVRENSKYMKTT